MSVYNSLDWRQKEKGMTEDEMVGWHHQLDGHESEQTLGVGDDREAWCAAVHGVAKNWTWLSDWTELTIVSPDFGYLNFYHSAKLSDESLLNS